MFLKKYLGLGDEGVIELYAPKTADLESLRLGMELGEFWSKMEKAKLEELEKCNPAFRKAYMLMRGYASDVRL